MKNLASWLFVVGAVGLLVLLVANLRRREVARAAIASAAPAAAAPVPASSTPLATPPATGAANPTPDPKAGAAPATAGEPKSPPAPAAKPSAVPAPPEVFQLLDQALKGKKPMGDLTPVELPEGVKGQTVILQSTRWRLKQNPGDLGESLNLMRRYLKLPVEQRTKYMDRSDDYTQLWVVPLPAPAAIGLAYKAKLTPSQLPHEQYREVAWLGEGHGYAWFLYAPIYEWIPAQEQLALKNGEDAVAGAIRGVRVEDKGSLTQNNCRQYLTGHAVAALPAINRELEAKTPKPDQLILALYSGTEPAVAEWLVAHADAADKAVAESVRQALESTARKEAGALYLRWLAEDAGKKDTLQLVRAASALELAVPDPVWQRVLASPTCSEEYRLALFAQRRQSGKPVAPELLEDEKTIKTAGVEDAPGFNQPQVDAAVERLLKAADPEAAAAIGLTLALWQERPKVGPANAAGERILKGLPGGQGLALVQLLNRTCRTYEQRALRALPAKFTSAAEKKPEPARPPPEASPPPKPASEALPPAKPAPETSPPAAAAPPAGANEPPKPAAEAKKPEPAPVLPPELRVLEGPLKGKKPVGELAAVDLPEGVKGQTLVLQTTSWRLKKSPGDLNESLRQLRTYMKMPVEERIKYMDRTDDHLQVWIIPLPAPAVVGAEYKAKLKPTELPHQQYRELAWLGQGHGYAWFLYAPVYEWIRVQDELQLTNGEDALAAAIKGTRTEDKGSLTENNCRQYLTQHAAQALPYIDREVAAKAPKYEQLFYALHFATDPAVAEWLVRQVASPERVVADGARQALQATPRKEAAALYLRWLDEGVGKTDTSRLTAAASSLQLTVPAPLLQRVLDSPSCADEYRMALALQRQAAGKPVPPALLEDEKAIKLHGVEGGKEASPPDVAAAVERLLAAPDRDVVAAIGVSLALWRERAKAGPANAAGQKMLRDLPNGQGLALVKQLAKSCRTYEQGALHNLVTVLEAPAPAAAGGENKTAPAPEPEKRVAPATPAPAPTK